MREGLEQDLRLWGVMLIGIVCKGTVDMITKFTEAVKSYLTSRPKLEIEASATWLLLLFVYMHGLTESEFEIHFDWSRIPPITKVPQLTVLMAITCLVISIVTLAYPLFPSLIRRRLESIRQSIVGQYLYRIGVLAAFILGLANGVDLLGKNFPAFAWLIEITLNLGIVIFTVMLVRLIWTPISKIRSTRQKCQR